MERIITICFMLIMSFVTTYGQKLKPLKAVATSEKVIALTFDDGLEPEIHKQIITILKEESAQATFFFVGEKIKDLSTANTKAKKQIKKTIKRGHEIGNHSMTHPKLPTLSQEEIKTEIVNFQQLMQEEFDYTPLVFRAPFLQYDERVMQVLIKENLIPINASVGTRDYADSVTKQDIIKAATESPKAGPGSIILMHELHKTVNALPEIIAYYKQEGYEFVTVSELIKYK